MRVKTETRRQAILDVAADAFRESGFDGTSMSDVAARVGGSKATLYNYFCSKEALFAQVLMEAIRAQARPIVETFVSEPDFEVGVRAFGRDFVRLMLQPDVIAMNRMWVAEGERCGVGSELYEEGPKILLSLISARLKRAMDEGVLGQADPARAAQHLKALCEAGLVDRRLRGCRSQPSDQEIDESVDAAVDAFLRAYRP